MVYSSAIFIPSACKRRLLSLQTKQICLVFLPWDCTCTLRTPWANLFGIFALGCTCTLHTPWANLFGMLALLMYLHPPHPLCKFVWYCCCGVYLYPPHPLCKFVWYSRPGGVPTPSTSFLSTPMISLHQCKCCQFAGVNPADSQWQAQQQAD